MSDDVAAAPKHGGLSFAVDFGPLLIFFLTYKFVGSGGIASMITATLVFMVAIVISIIVGLVVLKRVSPMTWISAILILGTTCLALLALRFGGGTRSVAESLAE